MKFGIEVVFAGKLEYVRTRAFMKLWVVGVDLTEFFAEGAQMVNTEGGKRYAYSVMA